MRRFTLIAVTLWSAATVATSCAISNDFEKIDAAAGGGGGSGGGGAGGTGGSAPCGERPADPPSCDGSNPTVDDYCGPDNDSWCCDINCVPGGDFFRSYDGEAPFDDDGWPASVSPFWLDYYEVTVGRFRTFMNAVDAGWRPADGQGAHPNAPGSGWDASWNTMIYTTVQQVTDALITATECTASLDYVNWTATPMSDRSEAMPMNCVSWFVAMAFCIWDGGRLPSEAEWNFAAAGGSDQSKYPWGDTPAPDTSYAVLGCYPDNGCAGDPMQPPGSKEDKGGGPYGHADLAGNVFEWTLDRRILSDDLHQPLADQSYKPATCDDCVDLSDSDPMRNPAWHRAIRGGVWFLNATEHDIPNDARISARGSIDGLLPSYGAGIRCARDVQ